MRAIYIAIVLAAAIINAAARVQPPVGGAVQPAEEQHPPMHPSDEPQSGHVPLPPPPSKPEVHEALDEDDLWWFDDVQTGLEIDPSASQNKNNAEDKTRPHHCNNENDEKMPQKEECPKEGKDSMVPHHEGNDAEGNEMGAPGEENSKSPDSKQPQHGHHHGDNKRPQMKPHPGHHPGMKDKVADIKANLDEKLQADAKPQSLASQHITKLGDNGKSKDKSEKKSFDINDEGPKIEAPPNSPLIIVATVLSAVVFVVIVVSIIYCIARCCCSKSDRNNRHLRLHDAEMNAQPGQMAYPPPPTYPFFMNSMYGYQPVPYAFAPINAMPAPLPPQTAPVGTTAPAPQAAGAEPEMPPAAALYPTQAPSTMPRN